MLKIASIRFLIPMCTNVLEYVSDSGRLAITTRHCTRIWLASGVSSPHVLLQYHFAFCNETTAVNITHVLFKLYVHTHVLSEMACVTEAHAFKAATRNLALM